MEGKNPKISVVMPCYNHEEFVAEAIESVLAQTYQDFEFIVCNNGSTDRCGEIIDRYGDRLHVITLEENNGRRCHELLYEAARGEFLAWIASDDYWYPDKLEAQVEAIRQFPECNIFFAWAEVTGSNLQDVIDRKRFAQKNRSRYKWIQEMIIKGTLMDASSILVRNDGRLLKYQEDIERFRQLTDFKTYLNMVLEEDIYVVEKFLVKHRTHGKNLSVPTMDAMIRTVNERGYITYEIWEQLTDEEFVEAFGEKECGLKAPEDIMCQRMLIYMKLAVNIPGCESYALAYVWRHYFDSGVSELLKSKYGFTKQDLYQYTSETGEGKYWGMVQESERASKRKKYLLEIIRCNNKIITCADNQSLRGELLQLIRKVLDNLRNIGVDDALLQTCVEKQTYLEQLGIIEGIWLELINDISMLNKRLECECGLE